MHCNEREKMSVSNSDSSHIFAVGLSFFKLYLARN